MANDKIVLDLEVDKTSTKKTLDSTEKQVKASGEKMGKSFSSSFGGAVAIGAAAAATAIAGILASKKLIEAASIQEDAVNKLNTALKVSGDYSESASIRMQNFASELQAVSTFGDEGTLSQIALAKAMGATNDQAIDIVKASADMAVALDIDLRTAVDQLSRSLGGTSGRLALLVPELKGLTAEQLKAGDAITVISKKYSGFASGVLDTYSGKTQQLSNNFGDFLENLGMLIIKSPAAADAISAMDRAVTGLNATLAPKEIPLAQQLANATTQMNSVLGLIAGKSKQTAGFITDVTDSMVNLLGGNTEALKERQIDLQNTIDEIVTKMKDTYAAESVAAKARAAKAKEDAINAEKTKNALILAELNKFGVTTIAQIDARESQANISLRQALERELITREEFELRKDEMTARFKVQRDALMAQSAPSNNLMDNFKEGFSNAMTDSENLLREKAMVMSKLFKGIGVSAKNGLGTGVADGFAAMGAAIVNGENALGAFAKAFLSSIGQMAIQQGTAFILQGIGYQFVPGMQGFGSALIGAGAAMATFGGALSAISGGSPETTASSVAADPIAGYSSTADTEAIISQDEAKASVTLNIEGNYFDSPESNLKIIDMLNAAIDTNDVQIRQGAFA